MYKMLTSKGQLFALLLGILVIAIVLISIVTGINGAGYDLSTDLNQVLKDNPGEPFNYFNPMVTLVGLMIVIAAAAWLLFSLWQLISAPKQSIKGLLGVAALIVIFIIFFSISQNETSGSIWDTIQKFNVSETASKIISGGLKTTLTLAILAIGAMIVFEVVNIFK